MTKLDFATDRALADRVACAAVNIGDLLAPPVSAQWHPGAARLPRLSDLLRALDADSWPAGAHALDPWSTPPGLPVAGDRWAGRRSAALWSGAARSNRLSTAVGSDVDSPLLDEATAALGRRRPLTHCSQWWPAPGCAGGGWLELSAMAFGHGPDGPRSLLAVTTLWRRVGRSQLEPVSVPGRSGLLLLTAAAAAAPTGPGLGSGPNGVSGTAKMSGLTAFVHLAGVPGRDRHGPSQMVLNAWRRELLWANRGQVS